MTQATPVAEQGDVGAMYNLAFGISKGRKNEVCRMHSNIANELAQKRQYFENMCR